MVLFFKPHCFFSTSIVLNSNRKKELVFQSYLLFLLYLLFFLCRKKLICFSPPSLATQSFIQCLLNKRKTKEKKLFLPNIFPPFLLHIVFWPFVLFVRRSRRGKVRRNIFAFLAEKKEKKRKVLEMFQRDRESAKAKAKAKAKKQK